MATNLEMKAAYRSLVQAKRFARSIRARSAGMIRQTDTYFNVKSGRLKLREIDGGSSELIYYRRPDVNGSRYSDYTIVQLTDPRAAKAIFRSLFGVSVVVRKKRILFLYENARIHLDSVEGLGSFIEFEVIVNRGKKQARSLMLLLRKEFRIDPASIVSGSYCDMVEKK